MKVQITFRSGAQITFDAEKIDVTHGYGDRLAALRWESGDQAPGRAKLFALEGTLDDIQAIVTTQDEATA